MSNVFSTLTKKPLGEGIEYMIIEKNNKKVNKTITWKYFFSIFR